MLGSALEEAYQDQKNREAMNTPSNWGGWQQANSGGGFQTPQTIDLENIGNILKILGQGVKGGARLANEFNPGQAYADVITSQTTQRANPGFIQQRRAEIGEDLNPFMKMLNDGWLKLQGGK